MAPAVAAALQGLCLLHKWGLEPKLDQQLLLLLEHLQGFNVAAAGGLLTQSSSTSLPLSPTTPSTPAAAVAAAAAPAAVHATHWVDEQQASAAAGQQLQLLTQLQVLLCGPAAGSPVLQSGAPCLSQEVLLSPNHHAAVIALPSAHSNSNSMHSRGNTHHRQQQVQAGPASVDTQQSSIGGGDVIAAATKPHAVLIKPPCLLLATCPSLLSCR
jgi:hypothetical protein